MTVTVEEKLVELGVALPEPVTPKGECLHAPTTDV